MFEKHSLTHQKMGDPSKTSSIVSPPPAFHIMTKPRGPICNLDCQYCFYLSKGSLYPNSQFFMSDELLEEYTRQYITSQKLQEVVFSWQGGEPTLMGIDFYQKAIAFQQRYRRPGITIHNSLQTNGTTLNDEWAKFFRKHNFLIGISLDGPRNLHDINRVDKGGRPTFDRVIAGINILRNHQVDFNIIACVSAANADHPLDVYRFLRDEVEAEYIQFIPIVERERRKDDQSGVGVTRRTVSGLQYGQFLIKIFDEWIKHDVGKVFVQIFDVALGVWHGQFAGLCIFNETCGLALAMEHNGDIYSCDHFVEPSYYLGNIQKNALIELVASHKQRLFGLAKRDLLPEYCHKCEWRFICNGGCPKNRISCTPNGGPGLNYLCEGYKAFFAHIDRPMKLMSTLLQLHRAPAEIMTLLERKEAPIISPIPSHSPVRSKTNRKRHRR